MNRFVFVIHVRVVVKHGTTLFPSGPKFKMTLQFFTEKFSPPEIEEVWTIVKISNTVRKALVFFTCA